MSSLSFIEKGLLTHTFKTGFFPKDELTLTGGQASSTYKHNCQSKIFYIYFGEEIWISLHCNNHFYISGPLERSPVSTLIAFLGLKKEILSLDVDHLAKSDALDTLPQPGGLGYRISQGMKLDLLKFVEKNLDQEGVKVEIFAHADL